MTGDIDNVRRFRDKYGDGVNWDKAEHGWTKYYDDGIVTTNPDVFFRKRKKHGRK